MKKFLFILPLLILSACAVPKKSKNPSAAAKEISAQKNDAGEWDLEVLDPQYSYFLSAIAKPMSQYSENLLKAKNIQLVNEWNSYFYSGRYPNIIESGISYDPQEKYGLKFEYKLYQVFAYVRWKYGLKFSGLSQGDTF